MEKIYIKTLIGKTIEVNIHTGMNILDVKKEIEKYEGINTCFQRLIFNGKEYDNNINLLECGIKDTSVLYLVSRSI